MQNRIQTRLFLFLTLPLLIILLFALWHTRSILHEESLNRVKSHLFEQVLHQAAEISAQLAEIEGIANASANVLSINPLFNESKIKQILSANVLSDNIIYGAAIAYEPRTYNDKKLFSPYVYRTTSEPTGGMSDGVAYIDIATDAYDYTEPQWQWWNGPKTSSASIWTNPYYDEGAGNILMVTYSTPFFRGDSFAGVTTIDIDITALHKTLSLEGLSSDDYAIITNTGHFAYHYNHELIGESMFELAHRLKNPKASEFARLITTGGRGVFEYTVDDEDILIFYAPVGHYGWSFAIRISKQQALDLSRIDDNSLFLWFIFITIISIIISIFITSHLILKPLNNTSRLLSSWLDHQQKPDITSKEPEEFDRINRQISDAFIREQSIIEKSNSKQQDAEKLIVDKTSQLNRIERRYKSILNSEYLNRLVIDKRRNIISANLMAQQSLKLNDVTGSNLNAVLNLFEIIDNNYKDLLKTSLDAIVQDGEPQTIESFSFVHGNVRIKTQLLITPSDSINGNLIITFLVNET